MEIHWDHLEEVPAEQRQAIDARIRELAEGHEDLIDVRIVGKPTRHHRHGGQEVHIACQARGREIVARRTREDVALALDEVMDAFAREVRKLRDRRLDQRSERPAVPPYLGLVDRILKDEGYGSILTDSGESVYLPRNAVSGVLGGTLTTPSLIWSDTRSSPSRSWKSSGTPPQSGELKVSVSRK